MLSSRSYSSWVNSGPILLNKVWHLLPSSFYKCLAEVFSCIPVSWTVFQCKFKIFYCFVQTSFCCISGNMKQSKKFILWAMYKSCAHSPCKYSLKPTIHLQCSTSYQSFHVLFVYFQSFIVFIHSIHVAPNFKIINSNLHTKKIVVKYHKNFTE